MANWLDLQTSAEKREKQRANPTTVMGKLGLALRNALGIDPTKPMIGNWDGVEIMEGDGG